MGTSNFYNENASATFVRELESEWDYDMFREDIHYMFNDSDFHTYKPTEHVRPKNAPRSFSSVIVAEKTISTEYNGVELFVTIRAIYRSGYYAHCNLDWEIDVEAPELSVWYDNVGLAQIHQPHADLWVENAKDQLIEETEEIFKRLTQPYQVSARASNGETMYKKVTA